MFAPKVATVQSKTAPNSIGKLAPQRSTQVERPFRGSTIEQVLMLQRSIGNQAVLRLLAQQASHSTESEVHGHNEQDGGPVTSTGRRTTPGLSWASSKIPGSSELQRASVPSGLEHKSAPRAECGVRTKPDPCQDASETEAEQVADDLAAHRDARSILRATSVRPAASKKSPAAEVRMIQRQPVGSTASPVTRPTLTELRTIAQGYIGDYFSAARAGLTDFEHDVQSSFDWVAFWVTVSGNVVWATACFATGGPAFMISMAGIAISTAASTTTVNNAADFHRETVIHLNDIIKFLNDQTDRVTRSVDADATAGNWDDNHTRRELLQRLVSPQFISTATGGLPNLNQPAVAASMREHLLIRASQQKSSPLLSSMVFRGVFEEVWNVDGIDFVEHPFGGPLIPNIKPLPQWSYGIRSARFVNVPPEVPDLNAKLNEIYRTYGASRIDPSVWAVEKEIRLEFGNNVSVTYRFDAANTLTRIDDYLLRGFLRAQGHNPDAYLKNLLRLMQHGSPIPRVSSLG